MSGPDVFSGNGTFDISTDDVYRVADFSDLEDALREAAFQLCAPSVTVRKLVDLTPDPGTDDLFPRAGWDMTATASPVPAKWVMPTTGVGATATQTTDANGFATFQWTTAAPTDSNVSITEENPALVPPGFVNDPSATSCVVRTPDAAGDRPLPVTKTPNGFSTTVTHESIATCTMVNRVPPAPAIDIQKATNGSDADAPPGPAVPIGDPVAWTYLVTNTGNDTLSSIVVTDDRGVAVTCPQASLAPGARMLCTASGVAAAGQYANVGSVTAVDPFGTRVNASDPSHYFGSAPGIDIEKSTNGDDADQPPGPFIPVGNPVVWTYVVRNDGNFAADQRHRDRRPGGRGLLPGDHARDRRVDDVHRRGDRGRRAVRRTPRPRPDSPTASRSRTPTRRTTSARTRRSPSRSWSTASTPTCRPARWCASATRSAGPTR